MGNIATASGCLYIDRGDVDNSNVYKTNKNKKVKVFEAKDMISQIIDRQKLCEKGVYPPLIIYPDGGTTNGVYLLKW